MRDLPQIPDKFIEPNRRLRHSYFFNDRGIRDWMTAEIEAGRTPTIPACALPNKVRLSQWWWEGEGWMKAEAWLAEHARQPWMPWLTISGDNNNIIAVYFRSAEDAVYFRLSMPEGT